MSEGKKAKRGAAVFTFDDLLQFKWDALIAGIRAMVTAEFEGDYQSGVEFLAAVLVEHADGSHEHAHDAVGTVCVEKIRS